VIVSKVLNEAVSELEESKAGFALVKPNDFIV